MDGSKFGIIVFRLYGLWSIVPINKFALPNEQLLCRISLFDWICPYTIFEQISLLRSWVERSSFIYYRIYNSCIVYNSFDGIFSRVFFEEVLFEQEFSCWIDYSLIWILIDSFWRVWFVHTTFYDILLRSWAFLDFGIS